MSAMMGQPKPQASLSSGLLARKGQARPAMRPQGFSGFGNVVEAMDDLGWNDMGHAEEAPAPQLRPVPAPVQEPAAEAAPPPVLREREALKAELETPRPVAPEPAPVPSVPAMSPAALNRIGRTIRAKQRKSKTAFTLRLDAERHLRLRLASAVTGRSAQMLVTDALDALLESLPEVEELAQSLPPRGKKQGG